MGPTGVKQVVARFERGPVVLNDVTLLAEPGELFVVVGPSGAGKSTLLRVIAGMTRVDAGEILIDGRPVNGLPPQQRDVAMVFEYNRLLPFLTVADNLAFGLTIRHTPKDEVEHRVEEQARGLRLTRLLGRKPTTLSAGEHGQVGIGRALMRKPSAFLLDEPLAHHDAVERMRMRRQIADVVHSTGVTTIYVTHDQSEALAIADRIAVLRAGTVAQIGSAHDLYAKPADLFVADFIGAVPVGLLPAQLVESGGQAGFRVGPRTLPLWGPVPAGLLACVGREVLLGFREEDFFDAGRETDPGRVTLPGLVRGVDFTGPHVVVTVELAVPAARPPYAERIADGPQARVRVRFPGRASPAIGSTVQLEVDAARAHVFDPITGRALHHPAAGY
jgi:multiple sugar transport system ATP-binding protein